MMIFQVQAHMMQVELISKLLQSGNLEETLNEIPFYKNSQDPILHPSITFQIHNQQ